MDFNLTKTAKCDECGEFLNGEHSCETYVFTAHDVVRVRASNPLKAWEKLSEQVESAIPYTYRGTPSCGERDSPITITSAEYTSHTGNVL